MKLHFETREMIESLERKGYELSSEQIIKADKYVKIVDLVWARMDTLTKLFDPDYLPPFSFRRNGIIKVTKDIKLLGLFNLTLTKKIKFHRVYVNDSFNEDLFNEYVEAGKQVVKEVEEEMDKYNISYSKATGVVITKKENQND